MRKRAILALAALGLFLSGGPAKADYASTILADGPIAYYRLSETGGLGGADSSGNGLGGLYYGGVTFGTPGAIVGDSNTAVTFDGSNKGHLRVLSTIGSEDFSIEVWMNTSVDSLTGFQTYQGTGLVWSDVAGVHNDWILGYLNNVASFFTGNPDDTISGTTLLNDGNWHHIVATRVLGAEKNLYVDGKLENTGFTNNFPLTDNPIIDIGGNTLDNRYFTGSLDEVAIYQSALKPDRVLAHYNAGVGR
jgi:hypothetical protein